MLSMSSHVIPVQVAVPDRPFEGAILRHERRGNESMAIQDSESVVEAQLKANEAAKMDGRWSPPSKAMNSSA